MTAQTMTDQSKRLVRFLDFAAQRSRRNYSSFFWSSQQSTSSAEATLYSVITVGLRLPRSN